MGHPAELKTTIASKVRVLTGPNIERCPACRVLAIREVRARVWEGIGLARCEVCGTEFLNPQPSDERLTEIYGPAYYEPWSYEQPEIVKAMKHLTFKPALAAVALTPGARVLDVGCATGDFASLANAEGFEVFGIDLNEVAIKRAQELVPSGQFHTGVLDDGPFDGVSFDAIMMFDFIEHVRDPEIEVQAAAARLADGGRLVISTPRVDSTTRKVLGRAWPQYREEHLTYFTALGMHALMQRAGLVVDRLTSTRKFLTLAYLYGQAVNYPLPVLTPLVKATWRYLPLPKHRPIGLRFGEMTVLARRRSGPSA